MAFLKDKVAVKLVAFEFGGSTRVFKCDNIEVTANEEQQSWNTIDNQYRTETRAISLDFGIRSDWFKEQTAGTACDRIDVMNALIGTGNVYFYPIYDVNTGVKYWVKPAQDSTSMLSTERTIFKKSWAYKMRIASNLAVYPEWLKWK